MAKKTCGQCDVYDPHGNRCKANPPILQIMPHPVSGDPLALGLFPTTKEGEKACGAFRVKETEIQ